MSKFRFPLGLLLFVLSGCLVEAADTTATLTWTAPTQLVDGSPLDPTKICCYNVERGTKPDGSDLAFYKQIKPAALTYLDSNLTPGKWCYRVYAITDTDGLRSNVVCKDILLTTQAATSTLSIK